MGRQGAGRVQPCESCAFRLIGYENRLLRHRISTTTPRTQARSCGPPRHGALRADAPGWEGDIPSVDPLEFQKEPRPSNEGRDESLVVKLRFKPPAGDESRLIKVGLTDGGADAVSQASDDLQFAAAVAGFGMLLRDSPHKGNLTYDAVLECSFRRGQQRSAGI